MESPKQRLGFEFVVHVPVTFTTPEEVDQYPPMENWLESLITAGHLTRDEAIAYINFSILASGIPSMMDDFLKQYRNNKPK